VLSQATAVIGVGAVAAGCGGPGAAGDQIAQGKSAREVTLRWSTWGDDTNTFNSVGAPQGVKLFNDKFPKIHIGVEPQIGDWVTKNTTEWIAGTGPDISGHCCDNGPNWARKGLLWDMEPAMKRDIPSKIREDFVEWLIKLFHDQEHGQFALPMYSGVIALYYNKDEFQKRGQPIPDDTWDWNKYREVSTKLTKADQGLFGRRLVASYDRTMQRIHSNDGHWVDPKDDTKPAFDQPKAVEALTYEYNAAWKDKSAVRENTGATYPATATKSFYQCFADGTFAMMEEGSWVLVRMTQENNIPANVNWDVAPIPKGPAARRSLATNDGWSIWKGSKAVDESWEFMKFLQGDEWAEINTKASGQQSARKSFQDRWEKLLKEANPKLADKNFKPFKDAITKDEARPIELFRMQAEANTMLITPKLINDCIRDGKTAIDATIKDVADLVRQSQK
jgi:multiple sugar transport system substrate-binding protein